MYPALLTDLDRNKKNVGLERHSTYRTKESKCLILATRNDG